ncbi:adenylate/guanylate cyclase domain-containing protein [Modestobacter lacusdianchii]
MDSNYKLYNHVASFKRIDEILARSDTEYEKRKKLPDRDELTYENGFYAYCSALFVDIRGSSELPDKYTRPALAKLYRAFISEVVAAMNGNKAAREINIVGDCVWGVFNTPTRPDIDDAFVVAARVNALMKVLNYKLEKAGYEGIDVGIGMSYGRALMIKAGYNGSGINDVVYMGDVVNQASKLAAKGGGAVVTEPLVMDELFRQNLNDDNTELTAWNPRAGAYTANAVITVMENWYNKNCK